METRPEHALVRLQEPFRMGMIWAQTRDRVIGKDGTLPWHIPEDLAHFKAVTNGFPVLHGRKSYDALPQPFRPLPGRRNLVLTRDRDYSSPGIEVVHSLQEVQELLAGEPMWVVGGGVVYEQAMRYADLLVVTEVDLDVDGDAFAPQIGPEWAVVEESEWIVSRRGPTFRVLAYRRA